VRYLPPFERIKRNIRATGSSSRANMAAEDVVRLVQALLVGIDVDEAWYLEQNEDVANGIMEGKLISAKQHFIDHGYFEGRVPFQMMVDEAWYLAKNPDVAEQVEQGTFVSAQAHFEASGYFEGRLPCAL
jgi:hypothetical protein